MKKARGVGMFSIFRIFPSRKRRISGTKYICNLQKDKEDSRDYSFARVNVGSQPEVFSLEEFCPPKKDQGIAPTCGSHAFLGAIETMRNMQGKHRGVDLSESFHYWNVQDLQRQDGDTNFLDGMTLRDGAKVLKNLGVCPELLAPYDDTKTNIKPNKLAYMFAPLFKIKAYYRLYNIQEVVNSIYQGKPVVFGMWVDSNFINKRFIEIVEPISSDRVGGHACYAVGFDNYKNHLRFMGSWFEGVRSMPYTIFKENVFDMWVVEI